ncbi:Zn-ribbon domain-containing OB-fold protein [Bordetella sp. BOR01]|uniref:Zn-ribbon domain-containing OB-fold protein n=1 Tax=Bordetella sp. BOR01 TaxID=2854779 RepID=UPI001C444DA3|nr:OB-fold domain-containing protein [Bordetella sp. BOR01]MBV7486462.1 OB-fold domain-containing protein [Bordetella sp. BOR01]
MAYFPADMPGVEPNMDDTGFWDNCRKHRLVFQACSECSVLRHPPTPICPHCHSVQVKWVEAPDEGQVYTYTIVHHASHPAVQSRLPYVVALLEFPGLPGVRLVTNVTDAPPEKVFIGMRLGLWWDDLDDGFSIPRFRPKEPVAS